MIVILSVEEVWARRETFALSLSASERDIFDRLSMEKRAADWLAGRVAAKRAIQRMTGLPFQRIEIRVDPSGRPSVVLSNDDLLFVSISHSNDIAAALADRAPIGLDVELIEPRDSSFEDLVLTPADRPRMAGLVGSARDERLTQIWSEKEAYAKLDGRGLQIPFAELTVGEDVRIESDRLDVGNVRYWVVVARCSNRPRAPL